MDNVQNCDSLGSLVSSGHVVPFQHVTAPVSFTYEY
jgi:hypothetical protein